jgi:RimJ/RimL family protein N-acetyltransferase
VPTNEPINPRPGKSSPRDAGEHAAHPAVAGPASSVSPEFASGQPIVPVFPDELAADGIVLRTPAHDDVPILAAAFADPVLAGEAGLPLLDEEQLHALLDEQLPQWRSSGLLVPYAIVDNKTGAILGGVTLRQLDASRHAIEIGYWLFAKARGRGVATQAVATLLDWLFANGLYRVEAIVRIGNTPSERVLERNGFVREGVKRRYLLYDSARVDSTLFSRLADDA